VYEYQKDDLAAEVLKRFLLAEKISGENLVIHSDNEWSTLERRIYAGYNAKFGHFFFF
jgi:hypothetical protein